MKEANFTSHAIRRISERCTLLQDDVKRILDHDGSVVIHLQKGGRYAHRLIYSVPDEDWFMVVQDGGDGGVLTVIPLDFLKGRTEVTAAHKRKARNRAVTLEKLKSAPPVAPVKTMPVQNSPPLPGWRINVFYHSAGRLTSKKIPDRSPEIYGGPEDWQKPGLIHEWVKGQVLAASIPLTSIVGFCATRGKITCRADYLMEHLPMTEQEISEFK